MTMTGLACTDDDEMEVDESIPWLKVMVWNIESFTDDKRPSGRKRSANRVAILGDTLAAKEIDVAILLETGTDAKSIQIEGYATEKTGSTGISRKNPLGETYAVLRADDCEWTLSPLELVGNIAPKYRQAVYFTAEKDGHKVAICALHAPSPGHPLKIRLDVIKACCLAAQAKAPGLPLIFCGDLNIKRQELRAGAQGAVEDDPSDTADDQSVEGDGDEDEAAAAAAGVAGDLEATMSGIDMAHVGPGAYAATTITMLSRAIRETSQSQPYDQVWCNEVFEGERADVKVFLPGHAVIDEAARTNFAERALGEYIDAINADGDLGTSGQRAGARYGGGAGDPRREILEGRSRAVDFMLERLVSRSKLRPAPINLAQGRTARDYARTHEYADRLFTNVNMLLLLEEHIRDRTTDLSALAERTLMSDHLPVIFSCRRAPG